MTNEVIPFSFKEKTIRTFEDNGNAWFCLPDIRNVLKIKQNSDLIQVLIKGFVKNEVLTNGGRQKVYFCCEKDLYKITLRSNSPEAEPFVDWVCGEVLPSIRKTGGYGAHPARTICPDDLAAIVGTVKRCVAKAVRDELDAYFADTIRLQNDIKNSEAYLNGLLEGAFGNSRSMNKIREIAKCAMPRRS